MHTRGKTGEIKQHLASSTAGAILMRRLNECTLRVAATVRSVVSDCFAEVFMSGRCEGVRRVRRCQAKKEARIMAKRQVIVEQ